jgi:hypothetical protein
MKSQEVKCVESSRTSLQLCKTHRVIRIIWTSIRHGTPSQRTLKFHPKRVSVTVNQFHEECSNSVE